MFKFRNWAIAPNAEGDPSSPAGGVADVATTPTAETAKPAPADPLKAFAESIGWRNPDEIKASLKQTREQAKMLEQLLPMVQRLSKIMPQEAQEPAKKAAPPAADVTALRLAILELDTPIPKDKRGLIERLYKSDSPENLDEWLASTVAELGIGKATAAPAAAPVEKPKPVTPDGGPPGVDRKAHLPDDLLDPAVGEAMKSMTPAEKRAFYEAYKRKRGMDVNVFADKRSKPLIPPKG